METTFKILIVDDEEDILNMLRYNLEQEGLNVLTASDGESGFELAKQEKPDLIILDIMMPGIDGVELCQKIRKEDSIKHSIIAFLTARNEDYSQIAGFEAGADDYISKPLKPKVFLSRVSALLKRKRETSGSSNTVAASGVLIDLERFVVNFDDSTIHLPKKEFELLVLLMSKPGKVFRRSHIYDEVWGNDQFVGERTIDVHIRKLREKLGNYRIQTVKGVGYKFTE